MDSKLLLEKILKSFKENEIAQVEGYKSFGYIRETKKSVIVSRETGEDTPIPFAKILTGIDAYKTNPSLLDNPEVIVPPIPVIPCHLFRGNCATLFRRSLCHFYDVYLS